MFRTIVISIFAILVIINITPSVYAQSRQDKFEVDFQFREAQRRAAISSTMRFTEEEAEEFWPLYDVYRSRAKQFQQRRLNMLTKISTVFIGMSDQLAEETVNGALQLELDQQQAKSEFIFNLKAQFSA